MRRVRMGRMPREADKPAAVAAFTLRVDEAALLNNYRALTPDRRWQLAEAARQWAAEARGGAALNRPAERAAGRAHVDRPTGGPA